jgi:thiopurine S-methyltransferase
VAARGHEVLGVELAERAVRDFFDEHQLVPVASVRGPFIAYSAGPITLLVGDFFALTTEVAGPIDALYDRAALVALPPELRPRYVARLRAVLPIGAPALVVTIEYEEQRMTGPPYPVFEPELRALYAGCAIELIGERPASGGGKCQQAGIPATDRCFAIRESGAR